MRFLHSMPRSWQACWPSAHSSTSAGKRGQRAAKVRRTVAWPQAVGAWIPPPSGSPGQGKSEVRAAQAPCPGLWRSRGIKSGPLPAPRAHIWVWESLWPSPQSVQR